MRPASPAARGLAGLAVLISTVCAFTAACSRPPEPKAPIAASPSPPAGVAAASEPPAAEWPPPPTTAHPATVTGTAPTPTDDVPPVIVLEPTQRYAFPRPAERPMMDQIATRFTPASIVVRTGMAADFRNDDPTLHNVRVRERGHPADDLAFNIALQQGVTYDYTFQKDAAWDVRCDVHQNMYGLVVSTSSPYTAVAAADGSYTIGGIVPGEYTAIVYTSRERFEKPLSLREGQRVTLSW